ncbi:peptidase inhibitor family I36 protein [Streptomyces platensis]|uniref:peptidase inhibitor family I36 protein n=1 Tax=Streptomyces platensis TaxID=58346 RepID=UPI00386FBC50|nr:peptidase inhibitor family I36 protein [Streptomyces platensis]
MNVRKRIALTAAAAALTGGLALAPAAGASAAPAPAKHGSVTVQRAPANCPRTYLCVYPKTNFQGTPKKVRSNNRNLKPYGGAFRYPLSAYNNGSQCSVTVYERPNYRGGHAKLNRGTGWRFIGSNLMTIYSNKWCVR